MSASKVLKTSSASAVGTPRASSCRTKSSKRPSRMASRNVNDISSPCSLVLVEWLDSAQPIAPWQHLTNMEPPSAIRCVSVGWLVSDDGEVLAIAPNFGAIDDEDSVQISGVIQIPTRCVTHISEVKEPRLTCPSSRPGKGRKQQAS